MSSRSSSIQQSDGSRADTREVRVGNDAWAVTVTSLDHYPAASSRAVNQLTVIVEDPQGKHPLVPGKPYSSSDGTQFVMNPEGVHIVQQQGNGGRQVTDIVRENTGMKSSRLSVEQHTCQGDHC